MFNRAVIHTLHAPQATVHSLQVSPIWLAWQSMPSNDQNENHRITYKVPEFFPYRWHSFQSQCLKNCESLCKPKMNENNKTIRNDHSKKSRK